MRKLLILFLVLSSLLFAKNTISKEVYDKLQKVQSMIEKKQYKSAKSILSTIIKSSKNKMEITYSLQSLSNIYINQNKYKEVAKNYERIINLDTLEKKEVNKMKLSLSQIYLSELMYKKSIKYSLELLNNNNVIEKTILYENLAIAYYYDSQFKKSTPYIKELINFKTKKEDWYRMLYSSYIETKNYKGAIKTLKFMTKNYKKEEYWMQLISIYQNIKNYKKSLATLELAYKKEVINKSKNLMYLVNILIQNKVYNKAAEYIETGIRKKIIKSTSKNFDIMVSCYLNAKNYKKLIPKLKASAYGKSPEYKILLANIYYNKEDYKNTIDVLNNYKFKKGSKYNGQKYIILALSSYELNNENSSKEYLKKAVLNVFEKRRAYSIAKDLGYKI